MANIIPMVNRTRFLTLVFSFLLLSTLSCSHKENRTESSEQDDLVLSEPVERDFQQIKESGILRMIMGSSTYTHFLKQGIEAGCGYDLVKEFANEHGLAVEVVIVGANDHPFELLNSGAWDVIAASYTVPPEGSKIAEFTRL